MQVWRKFQISRLPCCMPFFFSGALTQFSSIDSLFMIIVWFRCLWLNFICGDIPIDAQLHKRFIKFMYNIMNSKNKCVNICGKLAIYGSRSQTSCSINYVCDKYGLCKYFFHLKSLSKLMLVINEYVTKNVDKSSSATASIIRDFLGI